MRFAGWREFECFSPPPSAANTRKQCYLFGELSQIIVHIGNANMYGEWSCDVKPYTEDWRQLTNANFLCSGATVHAFGGQGVNNSTSVYVSWNYEPTTGMLYVNKSNGGNGG